MGRRGSAGYSGGMEIRDTYKVSGYAVLQWKHNLMDGLSLFGSLEEDYTGTRTNLPLGINNTLITTAQVLAHLPAYSTANFRFGVTRERDGGNRWTAALFV